MLNFMFTWTQTLSSYLASNDRKFLLCFTLTPVLHIVTPYILLIRMEISSASVKSVWKFFKNLKMELPYDPDIPLLI